MLTSLEITSDNSLRDDIFKIKNVLSETEEGHEHIWEHSYVVYRARKAYTGKGAQ